MPLRTYAGLSRAGERITQDFRAVLQEFNIFQTAATGEARFPKAPYIPVRPPFAARTERAER